MQLGLWSCMGKVFDCIVYIVIIVFFLLTLSDDIEFYPGSVNARNWQHHVLYSNVQGLHGNLRGLIVAS